MTVNHEEAHRLATGRLKLEEDRVSGFRRRLGELDREIAVAREALIRADNELAAAASGETKTLRSLRKRRSAADQNLSDLRAERALLEIKLNRAREQETRSRFEVHAAERKRIRQNAKELTGEIVEHVGPLFDLWPEFERLQRHDRALHEKLHQKPELQRGPQFSDAVGMPGELFTALQQLFLVIQRLRAARRV
jgi:chromosome segregation ATPase